MCDFPYLFILSNFCWKKILKSKLKWKWHHKFAKYFLRKPSFSVPGYMAIKWYCFSQYFKDSTFNNIQHFNVQLTLEANWPINFEYFKNGTTSAFFYSTGTLVFTCIKILCSDVCKGKDRKHAFTSQTAENSLWIEKCNMAPQVKKLIFSSTINSNLYLSKAFFKGIRLKIMKVSMVDTVTQIHCSNNLPVLSRKCFKSCSRKKSK